MSVHHTIGDVIKRTSLNEKFIRNCKDRLEDVLKPVRGANNALLFDNNAMVFFDQIAQKKKMNWNIEQIEQFIRKEANQEKPLPNDKENKVQAEANQDKPDGQTETNQSTNSANTKPYEILKLRETLLNQKEDFQNALFSQKEAILEKDRVILQKDIEIQDLNNRVLLLEAPRKKPSTAPRSFRIVLWLTVTILILALIGSWLYLTNNLNMFAISAK